MVPKGLFLVSPNGRNDAQVVRRHRGKARFSRGDGLRSGAQVEFFRRIELAERLLHVALDVDRVSDGRRITGQLGHRNRSFQAVEGSVRIPVDRVATELIGRCLREIDDGPTAEPGLIVPTEIAVGGSA